MKITRYLWISHLPKLCQDQQIHETFQSHGKIQTIRIHENNNCRGAIVAFIDCKSSTKALESVKSLMNVPLKLEYCESNGEPGITALGLSHDGCNEENKYNSYSFCGIMCGYYRGGQHIHSNKTSNSRSRSSSSNTSSFGSSLDDCSKYPPGVCPRREDTRENGGERGGGPREEGLNCGGGGEAGLHKDMRGLLVENLSQRSSDTSLREGLFHEYKKHGKITSVAVMGQGGGRHAVISFKRSEDVVKALEASQAKTFFGQLLKTSLHHGYNYVDPDLCPPEHPMDEYHPKATKTLFVGKLSTAEVREAELSKIFRKYGDIIDIDIKTQSNQPDTSFAFVQYFDISSVVRALCCQDSIKIDGKPVKLGFGKSQPANCLWVGNLQRSANDAFLRRHFKRYGSVMLVIPDQEYNCALVQFDSAEDALRAFTDTRERSNNTTVGRRMQVDYASNEYQMAFMNRLRKSCHFDGQDFLKNITDPYQTEKIQNLLISYTKYLGLLEETRTRSSYDRYEPKSDYEDYHDDSFYSSHSSRQRKSVHQRLYNESYGVDDEYSDDYHYSKPKTRHFDEYSSSRSPVRYSRTSQKYAANESSTYETHESHRSNYYPPEYFESKVDCSSGTFYPPIRRSLDPAYIHSNHNRSYTPSPTSSLDYCNDYPRYNLSPKRYSRSNKEYHTSRVRPVQDVQDDHDVHFDRSPDPRLFSRPLRRDLEEYTSSTTTFRSKSGSKSKLSTSQSPRVKNSSNRVRSVKNEPLKKIHARRTNINEESLSQPCSTSKLVPSTINGKTSSVNNNNNVKSKPTATTSSGNNTTEQPTKILSESVTNISSVVQPVDALSKLERERAKLLEELSLLSEDTLGTPTNTSIKSVKCSPKSMAEESVKSRKKLLSPKTDEKVTPNKSLSSVVVVERKSIKSEKVVVKTEPKVLPEKKTKVKEIVEERKPLVMESSAPGQDSKTVVEVPCIPTESTVINNLSSEEKTCCKIETLPDRTEPLTVTTDTPNPVCAGPVTPDIIPGSRDPRLNSSSYLLRPLSLSSISPTPLVSLSSPLSTDPSLVIPGPPSCSYKDSTSDSDMDPFSSIDFDVDKRIRELDAKMNRSEATVRTLDYSKFRIRKKDSGGGGGVGSMTLTGSGGGGGMMMSTSGSMHSSPSSSSYLMVSPSIVSPSSLLDVVGYSALNHRDSGSNTSEFIKSMLNQTKSKSYHLLSNPSGHDTLGSLCSNYSVVSSSSSSSSIITSCSIPSSSSLQFRTVDLGANDIERRTLFSKYGPSSSTSCTSSSSCSLPFVSDPKLQGDTSSMLLTSPVTSYHGRLVPGTMTSSSYTSSFTSKVSSSSSLSSILNPPTSVPLLITSPSITSTTTATLVTTSTVDSNQPMKSILKKSVLLLPSSSCSSTSNNSLSLTRPSSIITSTTKTDLLPGTGTISSRTKFSMDPGTSLIDGCVTNKESTQKKLSSHKRKSEEDEFKKYCSKKTKTDSNGPVLDDTLFQSYPTLPTKKMKKTTKKKSLQTSGGGVSASKEVAKNGSTSKNVPLSPPPASIPPQTIQEKGVLSSKKGDNHSNKRIPKIFSERQKPVSTKVPVNKKTKIKSKSTATSKQPTIINGKTKTSLSTKKEKTKRTSKCKREKMTYYDTKEREEEMDEEDDDRDREDEDDVEDDVDDEELGESVGVGGGGGRFSENESETMTSDSDNYESMYDKIKRRKSKSTKQINGLGLPGSAETKQKRQSFGKKRRSNMSSEFTAGSSDNLDSEDSEYWTKMKNKRATSNSHMTQKKKRARLSSHFSEDSNPCKTTTTTTTKTRSIGKSGANEGARHSSDNNNNHNHTMSRAIHEDSVVKDESITDESKAPAESFNLSSPHNSSQCSSPKYSTSKDQALIYGVDMAQTSVIAPKRSLHRPNDGPLKKRPITEPIVLSEDLPFLEKQPEEEYMISSPRSVNDEPPSQLESMYDTPSGHQNHNLVLHHHQQQPSVLEEEVVLDDQHHYQSGDVVIMHHDEHEQDQQGLNQQDQVVEYTLDVIQDTITTLSSSIINQDTILPADVDSASHILLTMKSQPTMAMDYPPLPPPSSSCSMTPGASYEPDHQVQSVAEHLISLAQNTVETPLNVESNVPAHIQVTPEEKVHPMISSVDIRSSKTTASVKQDDEVTIYVKNIIDRIKQETDLASSLNKEKLACKRVKKGGGGGGTFNIPLSKPMVINTMVPENCRHLLSLDNDVLARPGSITTSTTTMTSTTNLGPLPSPTCVLITNSNNSSHGTDHIAQYPKVQSVRSCQGDDISSTCSTEKRVRHNSGKSDSQLQSLEESIDNVMKSSISSSASDALSVKSVTDLEETKSLSNSCDNINMIKGDMSNLEETMNEVIHKLSIPPPCTVTSNELSEYTSSKNTIISIMKPALGTPMDHHQHHHMKGPTKKIAATTTSTPTMVGGGGVPGTHMKQSVYQLTSGVGGITNLVLGIPSILTVNTLVSQQNPINHHMVSFQNSVCNQNKSSPNQLSLPMHKSLTSSGAQGSGSSPQGGMSSLTLAPGSINIQSIQQHAPHNPGLGPHSSEMVFTKLNSLTPIMIQAPLRNMNSLGQSNSNSLLSPSVISSRPPGTSSMGATFVSIAAGGIPVCTMCTETNSGKLITVPLTPSTNKPITTPINVIPRPPITVAHGLNLTKISSSSSSSSLDSNFYLMMQRQAIQSKPKGASNMCQVISASSSSSDVTGSNVSGLSAAHSIILSQLTHTNSSVTPITPAYFTASISKSNTCSLPNIQPLITTNGIVTTATPSTPSILFRPINIPFRKFEEKDDWLKQNSQSEFNYPIRWTGKLCLKNDEVFVQMHMLAGNEDLIRNSMNLISAGQDSSQPLRIVQRMRLEPNQLEGLQRRLSRQREFCTCLTLAGGDKSDELGRTSTVLQDNFINYLQDKSAAGIINICVPDSQQNAYVIHIFPPCDFSDNQLRTCSRTLYDQLKEQAVPYLVIVITTV